MSFNALSLFFVIIIIGMLLGKIKFFSISFDISAVLIVAVLFGYCFSHYIPQIIDNSFDYSMNLFSKMGTALFISVIGITSGKTLSENLSGKTCLPFAIGSLMTITGFVFVKSIILLDSNIDRSIMAGVFCGSLTTTPGLSAVCEIDNILSENAILGYGVTYILGVIYTVIFAQLITRNLSYNNELVPKVYRNNSTVDPLIIICLIAFLGQVLGNMKIPYSGISLGTTGITLVLGIIIGMLLRKVYLNGETLSLYKNLGLIMFFVGNGFVSGQQLNNTLDVKLLIYGSVIAVSSILVGYICCKLFLDYNKLHRMFIVSGGMTSTPALAVLMKKLDNDQYLSSYSIAYIGALLTIVLIVKYI